MTPSSNLSAEASMLATVKYSLPELLGELELEKRTNGFSTEKLPQADIGKLFQQAQAKHRRGKSL
jgi:hypothetical protein